VSVDGSHFSNKSSKNKKKSIKFDLEAALSDNDGTFFLTEIDAEIKRVNNEQSNYQTRNVSTKEDQEIEYEVLVSRIAALKTIRNKLEIVNREKIRYMEELVNQVKVYVFDIFL
jgi:hypothetical protein